MTSSISTKWWNSSIFPGGSSKVVPHWASYHGGTRSRVTMTAVVRYASPNPYKTLKMKAVLRCKLCDSVDEKMFLIRFWISVQKCWKYFSSSEKQANGTNLWWKIKYEKILLPSIFHLYFGYFLKKLILAASLLQVK